MNDHPSEEELQEFQDRHKDDYGVQRLVEAYRKSRDEGIEMVKENLKLGREIKRLELQLQSFTNSETERK